MNKIPEKLLKIIQSLKKSIKNLDPLNIFNKNDLHH